jgi:hypothetical protein
MASSRPEEVNAALRKIQSKATLTDQELRALQSHVDALETAAAKSDTHHHDTHSGVAEVVEE